MKSTDSALLKKSMVVAFRHVIDRESCLIDDKWPADENVYLLNPERLRLFVYLCAHPCVTAGTLAKIASRSKSSVVWHLKKLVAGGFVSQTRAYVNKNVFYPSGMATTGDIAILSDLYGHSAGNILQANRRFPGSTATELCRYAGIEYGVCIKNLKRLQSHGLVYRVKDGRFKRYYPTKKMDILYKNRKNTAMNFRNNLLVHLKREIYAVEILLSTPEKISMKISGNGKNAVLSIPINPYSTFSGK